MRKNADLERFVMGKKHLIAVMLFSLAALALMGGCENKKKKATLTDGSSIAALYGDKSDDDTKKKLKESSVYENLAVLVNADTTNKEVSLKFLATGKTEIMSYTGGTSVLSKYDNDLTMGQLDLGVIVEAYYKSGTQKLTEIKEYKDAWSIDKSNSFSLYAEDGAIKVGQTTYSIEEDASIISEGKLVKLDSINPVDTLTIYGIGNAVYSINIDLGHGFVELENQDYFIGGLIEFGPKIIKQIDANMTVAVPEGSYTVTATKGETTGQTEITVLRNETQQLDVGALQGEAVEKGSIKFSIEPANATLYVDGTKKNANDIISLSYGRHTVIVYCSGYKTYSEIIEINSNYVDKAITMTVQETESTTAKETTTNKETTTTKK